MAFKHTYEEMLDKAYEELPKIEKEASRFEIPKTQSLLQGNKTLIKNIQKIASHFRRDQRHLLKFMLRELAAPGDIKGGDAVVVGKFRPEFLDEKINKYVKEFVLCDQCGKPDTKIVKDKGMAFKLCEACGAKTAVRTLK